MLLKTDASSCENKRWKEKLAAGLGQLMFVVVEARTRGQLHVVCWTLRHPCGGIVSKTFLAELTGKQWLKGGGVGGEVPKSLVSMGTQRERSPGTCRSLMAASHAKFSPITKSLCFYKPARGRRTTVTEDGAVCTYGCVLSRSKYKFSLQQKKLKTASVPFPSCQTCC